MSTTQTAHTPDRQHLQGIADGYRVVGNREARELASEILRLRDSQKTLLSACEAALALIETSDPPESRFREDAERVVRDQLRTAIAAATGAAQEPADA